MSLEHWNKSVEEYVASRQVSAADHAILNATRMPQGGHVLELGVGAAVFTAQLLNRFGDRVGHYACVDFVQAFLDRAAVEVRKYPQIPGEFIREDLTAITLQREMFDVVFCISTIHHLPPAEMGVLLRKMAMTMKPSGQFILCEDWAFTPRDECEELLLGMRQQIEAETQHVEYHLPEDEYCRLLQEAGFGIRSRTWSYRKLDLRRFRRLSSPRGVDLFREFSERFSERDSVRMLIVDAMVLSR